MKRVIYHRQMAIFKHRRSVIILLIGLLIGYVTNVHAQYAEVDINYYLPTEDYDESITTPEEYLGYQVGQRHVSHDELLEYLNIISDESPRMTLDTYALTHELRPLINLTITSIQNHQNLEDIQARHVQMTTAPDQDITSLPSVLYQGYSIHGDEASGSNASMLTAYYLAASISRFTGDILDNIVILFDPSMNPDGLHRFSTWVNSHRSHHLNPDPMSIEFHERWPTGRGNHYWFDLNRDWLPLAHPESRGRIDLFHQWYPNVLTDHHEMGKHSTFFFQPGVPERTNLLTPQKNQDLTEEISHFHMKYLDSIGSSYFTKERYDDYYYGKGSTYPDAIGCVGILFEQAGVEGHLQETDNGLLSFPYAIRNQVVTSFSTWESCMNMKDDLLRYKQSFFDNRSNDAASDSIKGYYLSKDDPYTMSYLTDWFTTHRIATTSHGQDQLYVPLDQPQYLILKSMMEPTVEFPDSIFYDVSTWTLPMAFDLKVTPEYGTPQEHSYLSIEEQTLPELKRNQVYAIPWDQYMASKALHALLDNAIELSALRESYTDDGDIYEPGTLIIEPSSVANAVLEPMIEKGELRVTCVNKKVLRASTQAIQEKHIGLLIGRGTNGYDAGSVWHTLDMKWEVPVTLLDITRNLSSSLDRYDVIIMPSNIKSMHPLFSEKLVKWIDEGGQFIGLKSAMQWCIDQDLINVEIAQPDRDSLTERQRGIETIGGAILNVDVDHNQPLGYGYTDGSMEVFHRGNTFYTIMDGESPLMYSNDPVASGYVSVSNRQNIPNAVAGIRKSYGEGQCIFLMDNPCFRGYWLQGGPLLGNAIWMMD